MGQFEDLLEQRREIAGIHRMLDQALDGEERLLSPRGGEAGRLAAALVTSRRIHGHRERRYVAAVLTHGVDFVGPSLSTSSMRTTA